MTCCIIGLPRISTSAFTRKRLLVIRAGMTQRVSIVPERFEIFKARPFFFWHVLCACQLDRHDSSNHAINLRTRRIMLRPHWSNVSVEVGVDLNIVSHPVRYLVVTMLERFSRNAALQLAAWLGQCTGWLGNVEH